MMHFQNRTHVCTRLIAAITVSLITTPLLAGTVKIGALVSGQVSQQFVQEGQMVKKGDRLLTLDATRYQAKLRVLQAQQLVQQVKLADARVELDQALDLYERTVTSKRTLDAAQLAYDIAKAAADKATSEVVLHQAWSQYVYLKAPLDAKVTKIHAPIGTTVYKENTPLIELESQ